LKEEVEVDKGFEEILRLLPFEKVVIVFWCGDEEGGISPA